jgi:hypothetical protein
VQQENIQDFFSARKHIGDQFTQSRTEFKTMA